MRKKLRVGSNLKERGRSMIEFKHGKITEAASEIPLYGEYDAVVVGGGVAGSAAAMAIGKRGYRVLLIEATSALGGLATVGLVNIPLDFISGLGREMIEELKSALLHLHFLHKIFSRHIDKHPEMTIIISGSACAAAPARKARNHFYEEN